MSNGDDDSETPEDATDTPESETELESEEIDASENNEEDSEEETTANEDSESDDEGEIEEEETESDDEGEDTEEVEADETETDETEEDETDETASEDTEAIEPVADPESLSDRLESVEEKLEAAETESDLDEVEEALDSVAEDVETLPEPEEDEDEDTDESEDEEENPRVQLEERIQGIRDAIEEQRGPYASDVVETLDSAGTEIADTRWTDQGESEVAEAVESFLEATSDALGSDLAADGRSMDSFAGAVSDTIDVIESADLDPDEDSETIDALLEAANELQNGLEDAQEWDDLTVSEQLSYQGFYDVLTSENRKDFPPELNVVRIAESENDPEPILLALDKLGSEFMEESCIDALRRMGPEEAFDEMNQRAQKRDHGPIEVLGTIGDDEALETLLPYIEGDSDPALQKVTLRSVGEIGSEEATQTVADRLVADEPAVRSAAARALGRIGDTRAIEPLSDLLADDEDDAVRASAAWSLNQIGTRQALEAASEYADDRSYIVQSEAEQAEEATTDSDTEAETEQPA